MTDECVVSGSVKTTEVTVIEVKLELAQFITILCKLIYKRQLLFPAKVYAGISATLSDLLARNRAEIRKRFVIMDRPDVITPTVGEVGATLGQEQEMMCSSRGHCLEDRQRCSIKK